MMKRTVLTIFLAAAMLITCFAGCAKTGNDSQKEDSSKIDANQSGDQSDQSGAATKPELKTLRLLGANKDGKDNAGNPMTLEDWMQEGRLWEQLEADLADYGGKIELDLIAYDQYNQILSNTILNGFDDYDLVNLGIQNGEGASIGSKELESMAERGQIIAVNEIWEKYSTGNAKKFYEEHQDLVNITASLKDGKNYYLFAMYADTYEGHEDGSTGNFLSPMIRQDWLDKLDLDMPKTTEELFQVLKAFQDQDANGNGIADEVAVFAYDGFGTGIAQYFDLVSGTVSNKGGTENVEVTSPWYQEGVKDYILFMKRLYDAGLLETAGQLSQMMTEDRVALLDEFWVETWHEPTIIQQNENDPKPQYVGLLCDPETGVTPKVYVTGGAGASGKWGVTPSADKEAVGHLMDYILSDEYYTLTEWGIEGYSYEVVDGKKVRITDSDIPEVQYITKLPALWVNSLIYGQKSGLEMQVSDCETAGSDMGYPENGYFEKAQVNRDFYEKEELQKYVYANVAPKASRTDEERDRINEISTDLNTYSNELLMNLIIGNKSMDDWDTYISDLKKLGLDDHIALDQAAYDRAAGR